MNETALADIWSKTKVVRAWFYLVSPSESTPGIAWFCLYNIV